MKKFLFWSIAIWSTALLLAVFYHPREEAYGQTVLQFDEDTQCYFIDTGMFYSNVEKLRNDDKMQEGLPVSFLKSKGCTVTVVSGNVSKEAFLAEVQYNRRLGCFLGALVIWFLLIVGTIIPSDNCKQPSK